MQVIQAIKLLSEYNPTDEIAISWWDRSLFLNVDGVTVSEEAWLDAVNDYDAEGGYDSINEAVCENLRKVISQAGY